jgi:hypothetical protein
MFPTLAFTPSHANNIFNELQSKLSNSLLGPTRMEHIAREILLMTSGKTYKDSFERLYINESK